MRKLIETKLLQWKLHHRDKRLGCPYPLRYLGPFLKWSREPQQMGQRKKNQDDA